MFNNIDNFLFRDISEFSPYIIAFGFFVLLIFGYMFMNKRESKKRLGARIKATNLRSTSAQALARNVLFHSQRNTLLEKHFKQYFKSDSFAKNIGNMIFRAGIDLSLVQFLIGLFFLWVLLSFVIAFTIQQGVLISMLVAAGATVGGTVMILNFLQGRQHKQFLALFPLALDIVSRGLKAGSTVEKTFLTVSQEIEDPVGREFIKICEQVNMGLPFEDALRDASVRVHINDFSFFIIALIIQRQTGGSLSSLVVNISGVLRRRQELKLKINALSAEAKATGIIVGSLPFIVSLAMFYLRPDYFNDFITDPTGRKLFMIVCGMIFTGAMVIKRMVRFDP